MVAFAGLIGVGCDFYCEFAVDSLLVFAVCLVIAGFRFKVFGVIIA